MGGIVAVFGDGLDRSIAASRRAVAAASHRGTQVSQYADERAGTVVAVQTGAGDATLAVRPDLVVAVHGWVGNWCELQPLLGPDLAPATTVAECVASCVAAWGEAAFARLRGEFAALVVERATGRLLLARDVVGLRPLFLAIDGGHLIVASEPRQVLAAAGRAPELDVEALVHVMTRLAPPDQRTLFRDVFLVFPGHVHAWSRDVSAGRWRRSSVAYWQPPEPSSGGRYDIRALAEELWGRLDVAIRRALPDRPCGLSLSGGLDSGCLWGLLAARARRGEVGADAVRPYTIGYPGQRCDETALVQEVLRWTESDGTIVDGAAARLADHIEEMVRLSDYAPGATLFQLKLVAQPLRRDGRATLLLGIGGDEWLDGGFEYLDEEVAAGRVLRAALDCLRVRLPPTASRALLVRRRLGAWRRRLLRRRVPYLPPGWLAATWREALADARARRELGVTTDEYQTNRERMLLNLRVHQGGVPLALERYAGHFGIELRYPYFDLDLMTFCFACPPRAFVHGRRRRHLQRLAAGQSVPPAVRDRLDKTVFDALFDREIDALLRRVPARAGDWALASLGVANPAGLDQLLQSGRGDGRNHILSLLVAEEFVRNSQRRESAA